jgi:antitoxin component YwqK of YwqJK toxin-antitoxin module
MGKKKDCDLLGMKRVKRKVHFKNGELEGPGTRWYETGKKERGGHFKNGKTNTPKPWYYLIKLDLNVTTTETPMKDMIQVLI